ncbi:Zinc finger protein 304 [Frankliniella fusca]|uniref:Zinc finger protein 304 n=1 Tax=Frankliniella fusca TaxID=407009 RepID=A0AAE1GV91_9NEOP|nr:Zinc finger protein 304 [Frankliniella fusca]
MTENNAGGANYTQPSPASRVIEPLAISENVVLANMEEVLIKQEVCPEVKQEDGEEPMEACDALYFYHNASEISQRREKSTQTIRTVNKRHKAIQVGLPSLRWWNWSSGHDSPALQNDQSPGEVTDAIQLCQASLINSDDEVIFNVDIESSKNSAQDSRQRRSRRQAQKISMKEVALEYVCRLCEEKSYTKLVKIFGTQGKQLKLADKIHFHLPVKVKENDELPLGICLYCVESLKVCDDMYQKSLSTDSHLRKIFNLKEDSNLINNSNVNLNTCPRNNKKSSRSVSTDNSKDTAAQSAVDMGENSQDTGPNKNNDKKVANPQVSIDTDDCQAESQGSDSSDDDRNDNADTKDISGNVEEDDEEDSSADSDNDDDDDDDEDEDEDEEEEEEEENSDQDDDEDGNNEDNCRRRHQLFCYVCQNFFPGKRALLKHRDGHTGEERGRKCLVCEEDLPDEETYFHHIDLHGGYPCMTCGKILKCKTGLRRHIERHTMPRVFCEVCGKAISSVYKLKYHMASHTEERPFACSKCDLKFKTKATLRQHSLTHSTQPSHICDICGQGYKRASHLKLHLALHQKGSVVPFKIFCDMCDQKFKHDWLLFRHKMAAHDLQPTEEDKKRFYFLFRGPPGRSDGTLCPVCGEDLLTKDLLKSHMKSHGIVNSTVEDRVCHENKHQGLRPHKCPHCGKTFERATTLIQHKLIHKAEKKFECKECPYKTHRRAALLVHQRVHSNERPYVCKECGKTYKYSTDLSGHMAIHTGIITQKRKRPKLKRDSNAVASSAESEPTDLIFLQL